MESPFDVNTLLNLTFPAGEWSLGAFVDAGSATELGFQVYFADGDIQDAPVTVTSVTEIYEPGEGTPGTSQYTPPVYGMFTLSNGQSYYIRSFGADGQAILASPNKDSNLLGLNPVVLGNGPLAPDTYYSLLYDFESSGYMAPCFAEGTRIETADGPVAVEDLNAGDMVVTAHGATRPVQWIGRAAARPALHPRPWEVNPVRVRAHAFGSGLPERDVRLSPGHAVFVDGVLVPVSNLINGATIVQEDVGEIRYYHVELESHDVLLAEGLPCESYLDDGNRGRFGNARAPAALHGRLDPKSWDDACAPLVAGGPQLAAIQQRLLDCAETLGWARSEEADLRIEADGATIAPLHRSGERFWFAVPAAGALTLRSGAGVLAHVMPGLGDTRKLGVALADLRIDGESIDLAEAAYGAGFHAVEQHEDRRWRWTDGAARLDHALVAPAMIEVTLAMVAPWWRRPAPALHAVA